MNREEEEIKNLNKEAFGPDFRWGVSTAAYQIEGAFNVDGKGLSIWDKFTSQKGKVAGNQHGNIACEFYNRFDEDISLMKYLNISNFRFSVSWTRILPYGSGGVNQKGIDYYNRIIDNCLEKGIEPWITLYHWDLPYALELQGGWTNRNIVDWFGDYVELCIKNFGDRVKYWMVLNEPMVFVGAGYFMGIHAPGKRGFRYFLPAVHHAALCQAEGGRRIKAMLPSAEVGTTFSCSYIEPLRSNERDVKAAIQVDALFNRLFIEPVLGMGYPIHSLKFLKRIEKYMVAGDMEKLKFDFDFIGVQNYTREIVRYSWITPFIHARLVKASSRNVPYTLMDWEVYPESIYRMLKMFDKYPGIKKIYVTENGAAFDDIMEEGAVYDDKRVDYLQSYLYHVFKAKKEGVKVKGYFVWTLIDNFEWSEGYRPRFGLVHVDFKTQKRTIKSSGNWYKEFLE